MQLLIIQVCVYKVLIIIITNNSNSLTCRQQLVQMQPQFLAYLLNSVMCLGGNSITNIMEVILLLILTLHFDFFMTATFKKKVTYLPIIFIVIISYFNSIGGYGTFQDVITLASM